MLLQAAGTGSGTNPSQQYSFRVASHLIPSLTGTPRREKSIDGLRSANPFSFSTKCYNNTSSTRGESLLALVEGCKHSLDISVPVITVEGETERVVSSFQQKARLPGFR